MVEWSIPGPWPGLSSGQAHFPFSAWLATWQQRQCFTLVSTFGRKGGKIIISVKPWECGCPENKQKLCFFSEKAVVNLVGCQKVIKMIAVPALEKSFVGNVTPHAPSPPNLSFMKTPFFISSLAGRCLAWAPIGGQMHPNCHSQPALSHSLIDSCQSPLSHFCFPGVNHALETRFPPVQGFPGGVRAGIPHAQVPFPTSQCPAGGMWDGQGGSAKGIVALPGSAMASD